MILLRDVTGNCYEYGESVLYADNNGINLGNSGMSSYNTAMGIANGDNRGSGEKWMATSVQFSTGEYLGAAVGRYNEKYERVVEVSRLTRIKDVQGSDCYVQGEDWYVMAGGVVLPLGDSVQVYLEDSDQWLVGEEGLQAALTRKTQLYYDRTPDTGAQVRVIVAEQ